MCMNQALSLLESHVRTYLDHTPVVLFCTCIEEEMCLWCAWLMLAWHVRNTPLFLGWFWSHRRRHRLLQGLYTCLWLSLTFDHSLWYLRSFRHCEARLPVRSTCEHLLLPFLDICFLVCCLLLLHQVLLHTSRPLAHLKVVHLITLNFLVNLWLESCLSWGIFLLFRLGLCALYLCMISLFVIKTYWPIY